MMTPELQEQVLAFLGMPCQAPTILYLDQLLEAYTRRVPWESVFRIARQATISLPTDRPRWPWRFWADVMQQGGGGTCFESNYAFWALLHSLGFTGYLTINDMGSSVGCHTAIVVLHQGEKRLVDVGYPIYRSLPLRADVSTRCLTPFHTFQAIPLGQGRYEITRDRHPKPYVFTLIDSPVGEDAYRTATRRDYEPTGHFNDEIIIHKVIGDRIWRFNGRAQPPILESFPADPSADPTWEQVTIGPETIQRLSGLFAMSRPVLERAFAQVYRGSIP